MDLIRPQATKNKPDKELHRMNETQNWKNISSNNYSMKNSSTTAPTEKGATTANVNRHTETHREKSHAICNRASDRRRAETRTTRITKCSGTMQRTHTKTPSTK